MNSLPDATRRAPVASDERRWPGRERWQTLLWILLPVLAIGWLFHECLFQGDTVLPTDLLNQFILPHATTASHIAVWNHYAMDAIDQDYPWALFLQQTLRAGKLPLWNPYVLGGQPHLATSMAGVFSPFKLLLLFCSVERALCLGYFLEFLLAALFMFAFLRELPLSRPASALGACAFALNGGLVMWYWREPAVFVWVPLALLLFERGNRTSAVSHSLGAGLALGLAFLGGNVQSAVHVSLLCGGYWLLSAPWNQRPERNQTLLHLALAFSVAILLSAVQWIPTLELMACDVSGRMNEAGPRPGLLHTLLGIPACVTFVFPALAGSTESYDLLKVIGASMGSFTAYIGLAPFTFFLIGAICCRNRQVRAWLILMALVIGMVFFTPLVKYLYHRLFIILAFGASVVAAYGFDAVLADSGPSSRMVRRIFTWMISACGALAAGLLLAQFLADVRHDRLVQAGQRYVLQHAQATVFGNDTNWLQERVELFLMHYRLSNPAFWLPMATLVGVVLCWRAYRRARGGRAAWTAAMVLLSACDLVAYGRGCIPHLDLRQQPLCPPLPALTLLQQDRQLFRVSRTVPDQFLFLRDNVLMDYGLSSLSGYESLHPDGPAMLPVQTDGQFNRWLDLANVKYLLSDRALDLPADHFAPVITSGEVLVYRNLQCLPRVRLVSNWRVVTDRRQEIQELLSPRFDPERTVLLEQTPAVPPGPDAKATVNVEQYTPRLINVRVQAAAPVLLVLADTWYPGWQARVDGKPALLYRADAVFRAVPVPAGDHRVIISYEPISFRAGAAISLLTLAAAGAWWGWNRRPRQPSVLHFLS